MSMFVEPSSRSFLDPKVVASLGNLPLKARRPMLGQVSGRHRSPHRGSSVEFAEYRKYVPGDDLRRLDWRAYGRTDRFYVKEFEADTNLRCCLVVDTSGSMEVGSVGTSKLDYARRIAATLAYLAIQQGDAVGLTCVADGFVQDIPPRRSPSHLKHLFDGLEKVRPRGGSKLDLLLHEIAETVRQRALILVLSDFFVPPSSLRSCFEHLRFRHHDVAAFHLLDPEEIDFEFHRPIRFVDPEGGPSLLVEPTEIADRYQRALQEYLDEMRRVVMDTGVDYRMTLLSTPYESVLKEFLIERAQGRGRS